MPTVEDTANELDETFTVTLSLPDPPASPMNTLNITSSTARGTILNDDAPTGDVIVSLADASVGEGDGSATLTARFSRTVSQDVTLAITYQYDGSATTDDLLGPLPPTVTIRANSLSADFSVRIRSDTVDEPEETLTVSLGGSNLPPGENFVFDDRRRATLTIIDNDPPSGIATVSIDNASVAENDGNAEFTVSVTTTVTSDVVLAVAYAAGTATLGTDLGTRPDTVTIDQGETEATLAVPVTNDGIVEGDETFTVTISEGTTPLPEGVVIGTDDTATGTITNDDEAEVTLSPPTLTAAENATFTYTVSLSAAADEAVTVRWTATDGTATVANDLQATTNTVTFAANTSTAQTFAISPANDNEDEDDETFTVTLGPDGDNPLPTGVTIGTNNSAEATIADDDDDTPVVTATVSIDDESVVENVSGGTVTFTAELTTAVDSAVVLDVAVTVGTATLGVDLGTGLPTTVTIDANTTAGTFTVPITDDNIVEGNETFTVTLSESDTTDLPDDVTIGDGIATGTIIENDTAEVTLTADTATANENGGTFSYTVNLSAAADEAVIVRWTATDGTATVADDLQATTDTVTFDANDNTDQTFTIAVNDDDLDENDETFTVTLAVDTEGGNPLPTGVTIGTDNSATATITDNDGTSAENPTVSIDDVSVAENGGNAEFTVSLTTAVDSAVTLAVAYAAGTATLATDLGTLPTTVTIDQNQTSATLLVPITNDNIVEGNETFTVTISEGTTPLPEGVTIGTDNTATGTITEDDTAEVTLSTNTPTAAENGTFTYTVSLSAAADEAVTVRWTATDGTATVADDLQATTDTVTFDANDNTAQEFTIAVNDDENDENDETFTVTLEVDTEGGNPLPTGVTIGTDNSATATITDNDGTPAGNPTVSIGDASVAENGGNAEFTVSLTTAVDSDVTLAVAYAAGTADLATDLGTLPTTVTIDRNQTSATLLVPIANDNIVEGNETFTVTISEGATPLPEDVTIGTADTATGTITEDDTAEVTLSTNTPTAAENGKFTYTVSLSAAADEAVTVRWTATDGTATVADDLQATTDTVTFDVNDNTDQTFTIAVNDDDLDENDETFTVTLGVDTKGGNPLPTGVTIGTDNSATATITDNDDPPAGNPTISIDDASVAENGGNAEFTVSLTTAVDSDVTLAVAYAVGTATLGIDLGTLPTTVTIDQNQTSATLLVPIANDNIVEGNETFTVTISEGATPLPEGVTIGTADTATGTITEDDEAVLGFTGGSSFVEEEGTTVTLPVSFLSSGASSAAVPVTLTWTAVAPPEGGRLVPGQPEEDLQPSSGTVAIPAGGSSADIMITLVDDTDVEPAEDFFIQLGLSAASPLPPGVSLVDSSNAAYQRRGRITDNDDAPPPENARVSIADATAVEDADAIGFTVSLSRAVGSDVTLAVAYAAGSADPGTDLGTPLPPTVTIPEGETSTTLAVPVFDDDIAEGDETFTATLGEDPANPLPDDVDIGDGVATGTITDNEEPLVLTAAIRIADAAPAAEDGIARFTITLEPGALSRDALLAVAYAPGTATGGTPPAMPDDDLGRDRPATVTIPAGSRTVVLEVPINDDEAVEDDESFTVTLSAAAEQPNDPDTGRPPEFVLSFPRAEATGTITDNDEAPPPAPGPSALTAPRLIAAGTALRRHANHIDDLTGTVARSRLDGRRTRRLSASPDLGAGALATGGKLGESRRGAWIDGTWAGFGGTASGRQVDVYGGVDYLAPDGGWLVGALIGYEVADLEIGETAYKADYTHLGIYGGARLAERLLFDASATHGAATPDIALGDVSASYNARRLTLRSALTGDFGLEFGLRTGSVTVRPRLGLLYSREQLRAFTDSAGGVAERTTLELGRFSAGPRLTWAFDGGQVAGGARLQWDFLQLDDGVGERISGAADIGVKFDLTPNATLGVHGQVDGIGVSDEFGSLGGGIDLDVRF